MTVLAADRRPFSATHAEETDVDAVRPTTWRTLAVPTMGTTLRLVGGSARLTPPEIDARLAAAAADVLTLAAALTRFDPRSALERFNDDPAEDVDVPGVLGTAIAAALAVRTRTAGLVDPVVRDAIAAAGYDRTARALHRVSPAEVASHARTRPAVPARPAASRAVTVSPDRRRVHRAPGVRLDLGGTAKGLAADRAARRLRDLDRWAVDVGGDVRVGGRHRTVHDIVVTHPVTGLPAASLPVDRGAVATSAITARAWRTADGGVAHHLVDPSTRRPAWTGILQVSARARTALEAEGRAKAALLLGPDDGAALLADGAGGVLVLADGTVREVVGR